jgi:hypothetical protein
MKEPKYRVGQPVVVRPTKQEPFDAVITDIIYCKAGLSTDIAGRLTPRGPAFGYFTDPPGNTCIKGLPWEETVVFPRNLDNKTNGLTWEDLKQNLKSVKEKVNTI